MKQCNKCGNTYEDDNSFCTKCGIPLSNKEVDLLTKLNKQNKIVILISLIFIIGIFGYLIYENALYHNRQQEMQEYRMEKELEEFRNTPVNSDLKIVNWDWHIEDGYIYIKGSVINNSSKTINYYKIDAKFLDNQGNVVDSDYTNDGEELEPNESRKFDMMYEYDSTINDIRLNVSEVS